VILNGDRPLVGRHPALVTLAPSRRRQNEAKFRSQDVDGSRRGRHILQNQFQVFSGPNCAFDATGGNSGSLEGFRQDFQDS
jgi:hypothetical protein